MASKYHLLVGVGKTSHTHTHTHTHTGIGFLDLFGDPDPIGLVAYKKRRH